MGSAGVAIRMIASLAAVLLLLFVVARFARRGRPRGDGPDLTVVSRCSLGSKASVAVVQLGDRALVVGVTDQSVTLLSESSLAELVPSAAASESESRTASEVVVRRKVVLDPSRARLPRMASSLGPPWRQTPGAAPWTRCAI